MGGTSRDRRLLETALRYLDTQGSVSGVASSLSIHENTVRQRMARLDQLLPGWRRASESGRAHRVADACGVGCRLRGCLRKRAGVSAVAITPAGQLKVLSGEKLARFAPCERKG
ncbi:helix-turn-helix domain-containing protein [Salinibacterium sp. SWN248]|uniref:helix-turn-helix domain-containing protein n=1 Tax=Salinibacterium sp. SWN248 TaxID=2792056 RepID=UPI0035AC03A7